jgi:hypothetical protein
MEWQNCKSELEICQLNSKVKLKLIFFFKFKSELNGFYFYCVAFSIRLGHERKVIEANLKNNPEQLRGTIFS